MCPGRPPYLPNGAADVLVDSVGHLRSLHAAAKLHGQDTRVVPQPPVVHFVPSQPRAMDTRLLTGTNTDNLVNRPQTNISRETCGASRLLLLTAAGSYLAIFSVADRVGLSVLDSDGGDDEVAHRFLRELDNKQTNKQINRAEHLAFRFFQNCVNDDFTKQDQGE